MNARTGRRGFVALLGLAALAAACTPVTGDPPTTTTTTTQPTALSCEPEGPPPAAGSSSGAQTKAVGALVVDPRDGSIDVETYEVSSDAEARERIAELNADADVIVADRGERVQATALDDPDAYSAQYATQKLGLEAAWTNAGSQGEGVTIAVLDSGVRATHEELAGRVVIGPDYVNDAHDSGSDVLGHGTHVAGLAAASAGNGRGGVGAAPGATVLAVQVLRDDGRGSTTQIADAVLWASDDDGSGHPRADVINFSLGTPGNDLVLQDAIAVAVARGVTIVAAAGNDGGPSISYPAAYPDVLGVGATDQNDSIASFSTRGAHVDVSAPGVSIYSTASSSDCAYVLKSGTSMATPYAAGSAALLLAKGCTPSEAAQRLEATALDLGVPGRDDTYGWGRIRPDVAAESCADTTTTTSSSTTTTSSSTSSTTTSSSTTTTSTTP